jgi:hypothetical protein
MGGFATEIFEIRDAARRAKHDHDHDQVVVTEPATPGVSAVKSSAANDQPKDI